ncbi:MAG: transcriptional repressor [Eggerthellaceae bacterium]
MPTTRQYKTKQKELILDCIRTHQGAFITIKDIDNALKARHEKVGIATIYRNLERLEEEGIITRTAIEGMDGICYRYLADTPDDVYFFLKCEQCGDLSPIDCGELQHFFEHVIEHHHVRINPAKTVFYGLCETCLAQSTHAISGQE